MDTSLADTWGLLGHGWAVDLLRQHIRGERLRHAYLFTGQRGVGRRTLALRFAQALNCPQPLAPAQPCRLCRTCKQIERMQYADLTIVQAEQEGGTLKIDQIRELQRHLSLTPYEGRYRLALLLRFEEAHPSAANALLKTLEEPPPRVILLLTAESAETLLPTVVSRCEVLRLRPLPPDSAAEGLQTGWGLPPDEARLLAHIANGRPGFALTLHQDAARLEQRTHWLDRLGELLPANRVERFAWAETTAKDKDTLQHLLLTWLSYWRDVMLAVSDPARTQTAAANLDRAAEIAALASRLDLPSAHRSVAALQRTLALLDKNVNARLALEVLMLDLPRLRLT